MLVVILFACVIGVVLALVTLSLQRIGGRVVEKYRDRIDDANAIVNGGRPPESWVQPIRQQMERAEQQEALGGGPGRRNKVDQIEVKARRLFLKKLKSLISFMEKGNFYDGDDTREMVVTTLRSEYGRWASCDWSELFLEEKGEAGKG